MSNVDWSSAPKRADFYAKGRFWQDGGIYALAYNDLSGGFCNFGDKLDNVSACNDYEKRPQQWPESEERVNIIGQNGNDGLVYQNVEKCFDEQLSKQTGGLVGLSAATILQEGLSILSERGKQYGSEGEERSFPQVAQAFSAITGKQLVGSDVCLILALVKQVRQYAQPRYHHDSAVDGVNYLALQAEELQKERL